MQEKIRAHIFVSGKVQGVFFRETTQKKAKKLGLSGWVKNLKDGRVEAVFEGDKDKVEKMVKWAKKGPFFAQVKGFEASFELIGEECQSFEIAYDFDL